MNPQYDVMTSFLLGQDFLAAGQTFVELSAHFVEEIAFDGVKHLAERGRLVESRHAHIIGACCVQGISPRPGCRRPR